MSKTRKRRPTNGAIPFVPRAEAISASVDEWQQRVGLMRRAHQKQDGIVDPFFANIKRLIQAKLSRGTEFVKWGRFWHSIR
jgi:hypothetical protein